MFSACVYFQDLANTHRTLLEEVRTSILSHGARDLYQVFLNYKERYTTHTHNCFYDTVRVQIHVCSHMF